MPADSSSDIEYPYGHRLPANDATASLHLKSENEHVIYRWLRRFAIAAFVAVFLVTALLAATVYSQVRRVCAVAELERIGMSVTFRHQFEDNPDPLPESLRERFGDRWWSEVAEVSHDPFFIGNGDEFNDDDVTAICDACVILTDLRTFSINSNAFTTEKLAAWPQLTKIEKLQIGCARLDKSDFAVLGKMKALKTLGIAGGTLSDEAIAHLSLLPKLEIISLKRVRWTSDDLKSSALHPVTFESLKTLNVSLSPEFDDRAVKAFGALPNLDDINLNDVSMSDRGLKLLMQSGKIRSLIIHKANLTDKTLALLADYPAPRWLVLSEVGITGTGLRHLSGKEFPTLILDHTPLTDEAFEHLSHIRSLDYLSLDNTKVTGCGIKHLQGNKALGHLSLAGNALAPRCFGELAQLNCVNLRVAETDFGDQELLLFVHNNVLTQLDVTDTKVTREGIKSFLKARQSGSKPSRPLEPVQFISRFTNEDGELLPELGGR